MNFRKSITFWSCVLIILYCNHDVEAAKASRRGGNTKKTPNYDHVALSYGGSHRNQQPVQHQQQHSHQVHQSHQTHSHPTHAPSAPALPAKPVGWNVPHHTETVNQPKTATNTQSGYPHNPPPYQQNAGFNSHPAGPPPPYSANPNPGFNSHPAGPPPPYSQNPNPAFNSHPSVGQPPAYPVQHAPNAGYPQQTYTQHQGGVYPQAGGSFVPSGGQQAPVITNNYYGQPGGTGGSSGGSSLLGTALAAGAGAVAGNALFSAIKPDSEHKTIIIHENSNAPASNVPPTSAQAPATGEATTAAVPSQPPQIDTRGSVSGDPSMAPTVPLAPIVPLAPLPDPSAPLPDASMQPSVAPPAPDTSAMMQTNPNTMQTNPNTVQPETSAIPSTTTATTTTLAPSTGQSSVPLAPFPSDSSAQAQKGSASSFVIFNISVYTVISILIASIF